MESVLFVDDQHTKENQPFSVEGIHTPDDLARASGIWISSAGASMLSEGAHHLKSVDSWLWIAAQTGAFSICNSEFSIQLKAKESCMVPPGISGVTLDAEQETRMLWITVAGTLSTMFLQKMGALPRRAMKQGALPSQLKLAKHIVQATVRVAAAQDASSAQLQQLLWAMLASHSGQPVAMDAVLSHEIAKVIDAMRKNQYKDSFSLGDMANLSRMPVETFRKRFVSEVGMPPQSYQLFCKMERAKTLLKEGNTVRQAGVEVGMNDPYHFSKTFKNIVGMSPSAFSKTAQQL
ncbi:MAG: helix-turn-helix transcriptional regulator [Christensenellales bacterium]